MVVEQGVSNLTGSFIMRCMNLCHAHLLLNGPAEWTALLLWSGVDGI